MGFLCSHTQAIDQTLIDISHHYPQLRSLCDLGCGDGHRTLLFKSPQRHLTGADLQDCRLAENKTFDFIRGDFYTAPLPRNSFDIILSFDVIEHQESDDKYLKLCHSLLHQNGILILSTPNKYRLVGAILIALGLRKFPYSLSTTHLDYPEFWHLREYSSSELDTLLKKNSFQIITHRKVFYGPTGGIGLASLYNLPLFHNHLIVAQKSPKTNI